MHWFCRLWPKMLGKKLSTLTSVLIEMNYYFIFMYLREVSSIQDEMKAFSIKKFWFTPFQKADLLTA